MSNNNFKDDFEKNRQSINPDEHQRDLKEDDKTNENNKEVDSQNSVSYNSNQQFPPRNAQRRKRRRETATNQSKHQDDKHQKNSDAKTTEGSLDDRYDEAQLQQQHDNSQQQNKIEKQSQDSRMRDGKDAAIVNGKSESSEHKSKSTQNRPPTSPAITLPD